MHVVLTGDLGEHFRFRTGIGQSRVERMSSYLPLEGHFGQNNEVDICCTGSAAFGVEGYIVSNLSDTVLLTTGLSACYDGYVRGVSSFF